jgi:deazaflavin-dependent oxidoreductase (nitroreductase family)
MSQPLTRTQPRGLLRFGLRFPIYLYRLKLGWLMGERFLLLNHIGRTSGQVRRTVIEVVDHNQATDTYYAAAAWGEKSDWLRNLHKTPDVTIQVGRRTLPATAERLPPAAAAQRLFTYAQRHTTAFRELGRVMVGRTLQATPEDCQFLAQSVPLIAFHPR